MEITHESHLAEINEALHLSGNPHRNFVDFAHVPVVKRLTRMPVCIALPTRWAAAMRPLTAC